MIMDKLKSNVGLAVGAVIFLAGFWLAAGAGIEAVPPQEAGKREAPAVLVESFSVTTPVQSWTVTASGRLRSLDELQVVAEVAGKIEWMDDRLRAGGRFMKGETLFRVDQVTYLNDVARAEAALEAARASLAKATADQSRASELHAQGNVSRATVDTTTAALLNAKAGMAQANASLSTAREMLIRTSVKAPFDALVVEENLSTDSYVSPGQAVATLMGSNRAEMSISLQQDEVLAIARTYSEGGRKPLLVTARPGSGAVGSLSIEGRIARISPVIDQKSRTATIIAEFDNVFTPENAGQIFGNDFMSVDIEARSAVPLWQIPYGAIRKGTYVWIIGDDGRIRKEPVSVLSTDGKTGIVATDRPIGGERVMLTLLAEEIEGMRVRVANASQ